MKQKPATPKMSHAQAKILWNSLSPEQKANFNEMFKKLQEGKLQLEHIGVDDNEEIQRIVLAPKDKPSLSTKPYAKHFKQEKL